MAEPTTAAAGAPRPRHGEALDGSPPATGRPPRRVSADLPADRQAAQPQAGQPAAEHPTAEPSTPAAQPAPQPAMAPAGPAPGPATVPGRHRAADASTAPPRSRSRSLAGTLWPLGALTVLGLVGARTLRGTPLPDDGRLAVPAYGLLGGSDDGPLSPDGLAAGHTAAYAAVTRAFGRHDTLVGAEREVLLVALLLGAVLVWRTARRLGASGPACAIGLLSLAAVLAVLPLAAVATPAALAVPWAALAGWLLTRPGRLPAGFAAVVLVPAVLLAPDLLLALLAAGGTALATSVWAVGRTARVGAVAGATVAGLAALRYALPRWDPEPTDPARWGGSTAALVVLGAVLLVVAALSGWQVPALRPVAVGLLSLTALGVLPPSARVPALVLAVPLAALLVAVLAAPLTAPRRRRASAPPWRRPLVLAAAAAMVALVVLAGVGFATAPRDDFGAAAEGDLLEWAGSHLPAGATVEADPVLATELQQAGAPAGMFGTSGGPAAGPDGPALQVTRDDGSSTGLVVARFTDAAGRMLAVVDPAAVPPDAAALDRRRTLGAALLDNPATMAPEPAAQLLRDGDVDPRLLSLLAGLTARFGVQLADLPVVPGEEDLVPVRSAVLAAAGGRPLTEGTEQLDDVLAWLSAQRGPFAPDDVRLVDGGLLVGFRYVTDPDGAVTRAGG